jgi:hypothetical protein
MRWRGEGQTDQFLPLKTTPPTSVCERDGFSFFLPNCSSRAFSIELLRALLLWILQPKSLLNKKRHPKHSQYLLVGPFNHCEVRGEVLARLYSLYPKRDQGSKGAASAKTCLSHLSTPIGVCCSRAIPSCIVPNESLEEFTDAVSTHLDAFPAANRPAIERTINDRNYLQLWRVVKPFVVNRRLEEALERSPQLRDVMSRFYGNGHTDIRTRRVRHGSQSRPETVVVRTSEGVTKPRPSRKLATTISTSDSSGRPSSSRVQIDRPDEGFIMSGARGNAESHAPGNKRSRGKAAELDEQPAAQPWSAEMRPFDGKWRPRNSAISYSAGDKTLGSIDWFSTKESEKQNVPATAKPVSQDIVMGGMDNYQDDHFDRHDDENWLVHWLIRKGYAFPDDLRMYDYKGWKVHAPKIQLMRIKNFLGDEDIDRTLNWERKYAEVTEYLCYLVNNDHPAGKSWEFDFKEACMILHTHWLFEQYHYGKHELKLHFDPHPLGTESERLKPVPGMPIVKAERGNVVPSLPLTTSRFLLHRMPEALHDSEYMIPDPEVLYSAFLKPLRDDESAVVLLAEKHQQPPERWTGREIPGQFPNGFSMAEAEDEAYVRCMRGGKDATAHALQSDCNFQWQEGCLTEVDGVGRVANPKALFEFASFRGAKRAALQQCLSHFASFENRVVLSPFRKLMVPTHKNGESESRPDPLGVVWKNVVVKRVPGEQETFPYTFHYHEYLRQNNKWIQDTQELQSSKKNGKYGELDDEDGEENNLVMPCVRNFRGPYQLGSESKDVMDRIEKLKGLRATRLRIERAAARNPRPFIDLVVEAIHDGYELQPHDNTVFEFLESDWSFGEEGFSNHLREVEQVDVLWLNLLGEPSANMSMLSNLYPTYIEFIIFADRVQKLLDDSLPGSLFASAEDRVSIDVFCKAINSRKQGPTERMVFDKETVEKYCVKLAKQARIRYSWSDA